MNIFPSMTVQTQFQATVAGVEIFSQHHANVLEKVLGSHAMTHLKNSLNETIIKDDWRQSAVCEAHERLQGYIRSMANVVVAGADKIAHNALNSYDGFALFKEISLQVNHDHHERKGTGVSPLVQTYLAHTEGLAGFLNENGIDYKYLI